MNECVDFMNLKIKLDPKKLYILAISGGIDSMVLLDLFMKGSYNFVVVHFNHQKRMDSNLDHELIQSICKLHDVSYHYIKLNIKNGNFQEQARQIRYQHLQEVAKNHHTNHIVTAHHLDDLAETVLMKLMRGSNLLGYSGMRDVFLMDGFYYYKPLLHVSKEEIYNYAADNQVDFLEDSSNQGDDYLRNRIRHHIIPKLKEERNFLTQIKKYSDQLYTTFDYVRKSSLAFLDGKNNFKLDRFISLHEAVKKDVISYLLETYSIYKSTEKIDNIIKQISSKKPHIEIKLDKEYDLLKTYNDVFIKRRENNLGSTNSKTLTISHNKADIPMEHIEICYNKLDFPLLIRTRKDGDILSFDYGRKKLKSFLIDLKVPRQQRDKLILVVDQSGTILWIPGLYKNQTLGHDNKIYLAIKES